MGKIKIYITRVRDLTVLIRLIFASHHPCSEQYVFVYMPTLTLTKTRKRQAAMWRKFLNHPFYREEGTESFPIIPYKISLLVNLRYALNEQFCQGYVPSMGSCRIRDWGAFSKVAETGFRS